MEKTNGKQLKELLQGPKTVFADFRANWCAPCRMLKPIFESVAEKYADKAEFIEIDVDENEDVALEYGVSSIPNVIAFRGGKAAASSLGYVPEETLETFVEENL